MEDNFKTAVEVSTRLVIPRTVGETIEDKFTVDYEKQKGFKKLIRIMVEGASIDTVEKSSLDTIWCAMEIS